MTENEIQINRQSNCVLCINIYCNIILSERQPHQASVYLDNKVPCIKAIVPHFSPYSLHKLVGSSEAAMSNY